MYSIKEVDNLKITHYAKDTKIGDLMYLTGEDVLNFGDQILLRVKPGFISLTDPNLFFSNEDIEQSPSLEVIKIRKGFQLMLTVGE